MHSIVQLGTACIACGLPPIGNRQSPLLNLSFFELDVAPPLLTRVSAASPWQNADEVSFNAIFHNASVESQAIPFEA